MFVHQNQRLGMPEGHCISTSLCIMCISNNEIKSLGTGILVNLSDCLRWVKILIENLMLKLF